ncbi:MAG: TatD family hydrolase [Bacteroidales bacterium]|jgi:TatD DNase family protein|nr:TatD family hydrolase [Bacteroidales bacterium]
MIDTHTHLYDSQFDADREAVMTRALQAGVSRMLLPNIDASTVSPMLALCRRYEGVCHPMLGLHPTSVDATFGQQTEYLAQHLNDSRIAAIGETGIDLYRDRQYVGEQIEAFRIHIGWAKQYRLPLVIHCRNAYREITEEIKREQDGTLTGVFHCFPGDVQQAGEVTAMGFMLGIGGVVTYKNADMARVVQCIDIHHILIETDAPYLPPVPHRGKRNESTYLYHIVQAIAALKSMPEEEVIRYTTANAMRTFPKIANNNITDNK